MKRILCFQNALAVALYSLLLGGCTEVPPSSTPAVRLTPEPTTASSHSGTPATEVTPPEASTATPPADKDAPEIGSTYRDGQSSFKIVGVGKTPFEYTTTGESLAIQVEGVSGTVVLVPPSGTVVRVDPTVPSVTVNGESHADVNQNTYLTKHGKNVRWTLMEYIRE